MSRLDIIKKNNIEATVEELYKDMGRRLMVSPPGLCPINMSASFVRLCHVQSCGKCVPCRVGLDQIGKLMADVVEGRATLKTIDLIEKTARVISNSADCAIGYEAANMVLKGINDFREDYISHIEGNQCASNVNVPVPCVAFCPAGVDIPGYIALVNENRTADAIRLIRKDNPFPTVCAHVCERPCESRCRRNMIDSPVNIRGLKLFAVDEAGEVPVPDKAEATGKKVAVIGGGPSGLTAAYYLALMGHEVVVYEKQNKLGGMLRYGIPSYRLPRERLDRDIEAILSAGVEIKKNVDIGKDITIDQLKAQYDCVYISIGAHTDKKLGIDGEELNGVISAVDMLRNIGNDEMPDFKDKTVTVIGGGNVAMDVARSAIRLGAESVKIIYRRRQADMTALHEEIEGAIAEGCEIVQLHSPLRIEGDENGNVTALWVQPQLIGTMDKAGRPRPVNASLPEKRLACDLVLVAIGQGIESEHFAEAGLPVKYDRIKASSSRHIANVDGVFAGGDCVTGPATVIQAIASGKVAAANIDQYLGYHHEISADVEIPSVKSMDRPRCGRVEIQEREAGERKEDFNLIECGMTAEEAKQESSRCLRCDHFGYGTFKGGRVERW